MCPCDPNDYNIQPPVGEPFPGLNLAPIQVPFPNIEIPTDLLEDLLELLRSLGLVFPSGVFKPNIDNFTKDLFDLIANLLSQIAPFLSFYNFIMALFKLVLCIIEVLCAIPNPFKIASAMVKLFTECLPPFLNLFPWLALIAMIIALILLIIALIEYIIATILGIIEEIIRNIMILVNGISFQDAVSTLAAIQKIAELTCLIQNILAIFVALGAIMAVIQALAQVPGAPVCDDETAGGCCTPDVCPPFIKNGPWTGTSATMLYNAQVGPDLTTMFAALGLPEEQLAFLAEAFQPPRPERWQLFDDADSGAYPFSDITTPILDTSSFPPVIATFWPEGISYPGDTPPSRAPYKVDLRFEVDPSEFNMNVAPGMLTGRRYMQVRDCIVVRKPNNYVLNYANFPDLTQGRGGVLQIEGGIVFEDDGTAFMLVPGEDNTQTTDVDGYIQATLNDFIHKTDVTSTSLPNDTVTISNIEYTFYPVHGVLMGHSLITAGCMPEVAVEKATMNAVIIAEDIRAVVDKLDPVPIGTSPKALPSLGILPNVDGAQECVVSSINQFAQKISLETIAVLQADVQSCLGDLREQALAVICGAIAAGSSQFKSEIAIDTDVQFTSRTIKASVTLKDANSTLIAGQVPEGCRPTLQDKMVGEVTLGEISAFEYDPASGNFTASISSEEPGEGELTVTFNGKVLSKVIESTDTTSTQIAENAISYTFIDTPDEPAVRRDATDVSAQGAKR